MTITQYIKKDGTKAYMFKVYLGTDPTTNKQRHTTRRGFKTKKDASIALAKIKTEIDTNGFSNVQKMTFKELYELWLETYQTTVRPSTLHVTKTNIENIILPIFASIDVKKITAKLCQTYVNEWYKTYKTASSLTENLKRILNTAKRLKIINHNPIDDIIRPRNTATIKTTVEKIPFYTKEELQHFLSCVKQDDKPQLFIYFRLLAYTGIRKGECLALKWSDIDLKNHLLSINKTIATVKGKPVIHDPKTKASNRVISLDADTVELLQLYRQIQAKYYGLIIFDDNHLFLSSKKELLGSSAINSALQKIILKYKLPPITVHGFRHTHCSLLFESGASIQDVKERLGHSDIKTTMNIYTHVTQKQKDKTADNFAKFMTL